ncbi:HCP-like protein [Pisolithus croceorrhizus]|nr:HCP-like protein [Pisolithus croceorrhizus]
MYGPQTPSRPNSFYNPEFSQGDPSYQPQQQYNPDAEDFYAPQPNQQYSDPALPQRRPHSARGHSPPPPHPNGPLLDHSHLRPGNQASLLSYEQTLELYRANAKKTQNPDTQFEFAVFMIEASKSVNIPDPTPGNVVEIEKALEKRDNLIHEAVALLKRLADRGHPESQYFLADCYANGIGTYKGRQDFDRAYPLFVLAAKHESAKALQFFRKASAALHPGAMYRLGIAELNGELGMRPAEFPHALHELSLLHENGIYNVVFLLAQAAELGYGPSAYRLGEFYEYGKLGCPQDPALSIHYYNIAAQQNHRDACFALTAWYLVGSQGVLPQSDTEAFLWAKRAADGGLAKALYAVGYFLEVGIGTTPDPVESSSYYKRAAELGDKRAQQRLRGPPGNGTSVQPTDGSEGKNNKDCVIM